MVARGAGGERAAGVQQARVDARAAEALLGVGALLVALALGGRSDYRKDNEQRGTTSVKLGHLLEVQVPW